MSKEVDTDQMVKDLMLEVDFKLTLKELALVMVCAAFIEKTKHRPELKEAVRKKVIETLKDTDCYKNYIKDLTTNN